jgi:glycine betaine/proline transport system ATP-binding protein
MSDIKVSKNAIIEVVAEQILSQDKAVGVVDDNDNIVGSLHSSHVINVLFGNRSQEQQG